MDSSRSDDRQALREQIGEVHAMKLGQVVAVHLGFGMKPLPAVVSHFWPECGLVEVTYPDGVTGAFPRGRLVTEER